MNSRNVRWSKRPGWDGVRLAGADYLPIIPVAVLIWISRYWKVSGYGLYEDDYTRIPQALTRSWTEMASYTMDQLVVFGQGRPLHSIFISFFARLSGATFGLEGMYFIGFCLALLNVVLFYALLARLEVPRFVTIASTVAFALYPGDVSQIFLTHSFGVLPSLAFVLLAGHLWLSGKWVLPALLCVLALLCYETPVTAFVAMPLLCPTLKRRRAVALVGMVVAVIAAMAGFRKWHGEDRVAGLEPLAAASYVARQVVTGPPVSLKSYVSRPLNELGHMDDTAIYLGLVGAVLAVASVSRVRAAELNRGRLLRLAGGSLAWVICSYPLTMTVEAWYDWGRPSRVHFAASVGCAIIVGCAIGLLASFLGRRAAVVSLATLAGVCVAALVPVQADYVEAHRLQRQFWTDVLRLTPDLSPDSALFLERFQELPDARHLRGFEFHLPLILPMLVDFPGVDPPPRLYFLQPDWQHRLDPGGAIPISDKSIFLYLPWASHPPRVEPRQMILLSPRNGRLTRRGPVGTPYAGPVRKGLLSSYLVDEQHLLTPPYVPAHLPPAR